MIIVLIAAYFLLLLIVSHITSRKSGNKAFFLANRKSPWIMVAFGMIGASVSGISFISVPGMVLSGGMTYLQTCMGFVLGYIAVAFILLPAYYNSNITTIYSYLQRISPMAYKTGAAFFILSKMVGTAAKFYVPCYIITESLTQSGGMAEGSPTLLFPFVALVMTLLIWLYTRRGGIQTLVWTDTLQTACMITSLVLIIYNVATTLGMTLPTALSQAWHTPEYSKVFEFSDWASPRYFWKQFISGIFIVIVMTGLDQDMMQKNLTCRSLRDAQKDMCTYGLAFLPVNLLFLLLGILLVMLCQQNGTAIPERADSLLTMFAATGQLGSTILIIFSLGIISASFSSADSALTALTTCFCVDIMGMNDTEDAKEERNETLRKRVHIGMAALFVLCVVAFKFFEGGSLIDTIYTLVSYTYGPLLGLFAYALLVTKAKKEQTYHGWKWYIPVVCLLSPAVCYALNIWVPQLTGYHFGYELLLLNGLLTFGALFIRNAD